MWRYLVLNSLWFAMLFFVNFFGSKRSRHIVLWGFFVTAFYVALTRPVDPFVWAYYFTGSLLVFRGAQQFKRWSHALSVALDEDLGILNRKFEEAERLIRFQNNKHNCLV